MDHVVLADGRRLDLRVTGPDDGMVLVAHHGTPGAAGPRGWLEGAAHQRGLRVVQITRPGYGNSTRHPGARIVDDVVDTAQVLDALGVTTCLVAGGSGGGPRALACAARLEGILGAVVFSSAGPFDAPDLDAMAGMGERNVTNFTAAQRGEAALRDLLEPQRDEMLTANVADLLRTMSTLLPEPDRHVLDGDFVAELIANTETAIGAGVDGWVDDNRAEVRPWGFDVAEINVPVFVWHGTEDLMTPIAHSQWIVEHVPTARPRFVDGAGHLSLSLDHVDQMLDELVDEVTDTAE